jgi:hypothetical protein
MQTFDLQPGAQPALDFVIISHGTIWTFNPLTVAAEDWWQDHVQNGPQFGGSYAVEHRYARDIVNGLQQEGFRI